MRRRREQRDPDLSTAQASANYAEGMARSIGLFEYLGEAVAAPPIDSPRLGTRLTHADAETFDDDDGLQALAWCGLREGTRHTAVDAETFDDDGLDDNLQQPGGGRHDGQKLVTAGSTLITRTDAETYDDDPGVGSLGLPHSMLDSTRFTESQETYDDDSGSSALSIPGQ